MSYKFSVAYICTYGRRYNVSEGVLEVPVSSIDNPKEFFLGIKKLMAEQCEDDCTSQYYMIDLCPAYKVLDSGDQIGYRHYRKFSDKFMNEVNNLRDPRLLREPQPLNEWQEIDLLIKKTPRQKNMR